MKLTWSATPDPDRPVTLVELTSCRTCSRILERVVRDEYGRSEPYEGAGSYGWQHRESRDVACDERDVARTRRAQARLTLATSLRRGLHVQGDG
jgi:hypothetical protein